MTHPNLFRRFGKMSITRRCPIALVTEQLADERKILYAELTGDHVGA